MNKTTGKAIADAVNKVQAGQPGEEEDFVVQKGHTLSAIAAAYDTTVKRIMEVNGLKSDVIRVGQKLKIPAPNR
ncbi:MAG: LysM peptidoglycan-binding domain-containing protein [Lentisphaeria bacterium]|nr:LysM peptidoglycan-binding domain-containing protein [Lentisphaeria bacterium]